MMYRKGMAILIIIAMFCNFIVIVMETTPEVSAYTPHDPIMIDGDEDFAAQALSEGWLGDGTEDDPYVIEGYEIDASISHGIAISVTDVHFIIKNNEIRDGGETFNGIVLSNITNGTVENQEIRNSNTSLFVSYSENCTIRNNTINSNTLYGIHIINSENNTIYDNVISDNGGEGILLDGSSGNILFDNTLDDNYDNGINLESSDSNEIFNNIVQRSNLTNQSSGCGIQLISSKWNAIIGNIISYYIEGFELYYSDENIITHNIVRNSIYYDDFFNYGDGFHIIRSHNNSIVNNSIWENHRGMFIHASNYNTFIDNTISNNEFGMRISSSLYLVFNNNSFVNNGLVIVGEEMEHYYSNSISSDNTVNGKPILYLFNLTEGTVLQDAGQIILVNCSNIVVENHDISHTTTALQLRLCFNVTITNNIFRSNLGEGIDLLASNENMISNNTITNNWYGINLRDSNANVIINNIVNENHLTGIGIDSSNNNIISQNNVCLNNGSGIDILFSDGNLVIDNAVLSNKGQDENFRDGGVILLSSDGNEVSNNSISSNINGIKLNNSISNICSENIIENNVIGINLQFNIWRGSNTIQKNTILNGERGILLEGSRSNNITDNSISNMNESGIHLRYSNDNSIGRNRVSQNKYGLYVNFSDNNEFVFNAIESNKECGIFLNNSNDNTFHHNYIQNNNKQLLQRQSESIWDDGDREGNYWSDYRGVDGDNDGVGESELPHQGVDWFPLTNRKKDILSDPLLLVFLMPLLVLALMIAYIYIKKGNTKKDERELKEEILTGEEKKTENTEQQPEPPNSPPALSERDNKK